MDVAVIIPVWNRAGIVVDTLDSIAAQSVPPRTVVVVDDGSTDGSFEAVERWREAAAPPFRMQVERGEHGGAGAARNLGVARAERHAYLHFLDSDDLLPPDFYARMEAGFAAGQVEVVSTDQEYIDPSGATIRRRSLRDIGRDPLLWIAHNDGGILSTTCLRWEFFERYGPMRVPLVSGADYIFLSEVADKARWAWAPGAPVRYRVEGDNLSRPTPEKALNWARNAETVLRASRLGRWRSAALIARRWRRAGNIAMVHGDRALARRCYVHAIRVCPWYLRAYRKYMKALG